MNEEPTSKPTPTTLVLVVLAVIVSAVVITLLHTLLLGKANAAITGGVVSAIAAALFITPIRKMY